MADPVLRDLIRARVRAVACVLALTALVPARGAAAPTAAGSPPPGCAAARALAPRALRVAAARIASNPPGIVAVVGGLAGTPRGCTLTLSSGGAPRGAAERQFEIGSLTKVFTGLLLADMVRRGEVRLDDPVGRYLPFTFEPPRRCARPMTLLDLATHFSGLPRLPPELTIDSPDPYASFGERDLNRYLAHYDFARCPGMRFAYSNLGPGVLGYVLARRLRTTYEHALYARVVAPLRLAHTDWSSARVRSAAPSTLLTGHDGDGAAVPRWTHGVLGPSGELRSTAGDLLLLASACLPGAHGPVAADCRIALATRRAAGGGAYAGLIMTAEPGGDVVWKDGGTAGFSAFLGIRPRERVAAAIVANEALDVDDLGLALLDARRAAALRDPALARLARGTAARYAGTYRFTAATTATVRDDGRGLVATMTDVPPFRLYPTSATHFVVRKFGGLLSFDFTTRGPRIGLVLHQHGADAVGWKVATTPRGSAAVR